jgi:hypothetical protein
MNSNGLELFIPITVERAIQTLKGLDALLLERLGQPPPQGFVNEGPKLSAAVELLLEMLQHVGEPIYEWEEELEDYYCQGYGRAHLKARDIVWHGAGGDSEIRELRKWIEDKVRSLEALEA